MNGIEAIMFDFGGTLDNYGVDWFSRLHRIIAQQGCRIDRQQFQICADEAAGRICSLPDTPTLTMADTAGRLCEYAHAALARISSDGVLQWDPMAVAAEFMQESHRYLKHSRKVLEELSRRFRLGCISNNWGNTQGWCRDAQLDQFFDTMIDSTVVGASKPNELIFQTALDDLKLPAHRCAYVGDKFEADIVGAAAAGLMSIWMTGPEPKQCPDPSLVDHRIETLDELLTIDFKAN